MEIEQTPIEGLVVISPKIFKDSRGYFFESYNQEKFRTLGIDCDFKQDNQSLSEFGTIRGIHFQTGDHAQAKLVRVIEGKVLDVAVDLRPNSKTFGQHFSIELSASNNKQLFVPRGFGHGFSVLSETAIFCYKCDNFYHKESESGIIYNDKTLNIDWKIDLASAKVSDKDLVLGSFDDFSNGR